MSARATVAVFCIRSHGHTRRCLAVAEALVKRGVDVVFFTHEDSAAMVRATGARFADLYAGGRSLTAEDEETLPNFLRYVTFAGRYLDGLVDQVRPLSPRLVVGDAMTVAGRAVAQVLGLPYVHVCASHAVSADAAQRMLDALAWTRVSERCLSAIERLREIGIEDAGPLMAFTGRSRALNLYCEPPQFLTERERMGFEPVAFFGSVLEDRVPPEPDPFPGDAGDFRVYLSLGTIAWRYFADAMVDAISVVTEAVRRSRDACALVTLGSWSLPPATVRSLGSSRVRVVSHVNQRAVLKHADVFVTHHGLSSSHEAIHARVPMLGYPLWWDQPGMSAVCERIGVSRPIAAEPLGPLEVEVVRDAIQDVRAQREPFMAALHEARMWELDVIAERPAVAARIAELIGA